MTFTFCVFLNVSELEKKYQEQIQALQSELEREREIFYNQSSTEKQQLESTVNILKEEESKLKSRVSSVQKVVCMHVCPANKYVCFTYEHA